MEQPMALERVIQSAPSVRLACRQIVASDLDAAIELLQEGFPERHADYWRIGLARLANRDIPKGAPRYGYVLTDSSQLVGIVLVIVSHGVSGLRGNVSSWYVKPAYRMLSHLLLSAPLRLRNAVLINISPAPNTIATIGAQGFQEYVCGAALLLPALARRPAGARVSEATVEDADRLLAEHKAWGCICLKVIHEGAVYPFIFARTRVLLGFVPCAQLIFAPSQEALVRYCGALGRHLVRHGLVALLVDASARITGLVGIHRPFRNRRFFHGAETPRVGDLTYTEIVIFGA